MSLALIDDIPISTKNSVRWELARGTDPVIERFTTVRTPIIVDKLNALGNAHLPVTLTMGADTENQIEVKNLYIVNILPDTNPYEMQIEVADVRFWWNYIHIRRAMNMPRRVGFRRRGAFNEQLQQEVVESLRFAKYSLTDPNNADSPPFTPQIALDSILEEIKTKLKDSAEIEMNYDTSSLTYFKQLTFQGVELDDPGNVAVSRIMEFVPGAYPYPDYDGIIRFDNNLTGFEENAVNNLGPELADKGHIEVVSNSFTRPQEIHILFTRECEVRFDFEEPTTKNDTIALIEDGRFIENVLPIPDFKLNSNGVDVAQGTFMDIGSYIASITSPTGTIKDIDFPLIRQAMVLNEGIWSALGLAGSVDLTSEEADWAARWAAIQTHFRTTMRINRVWTDRMYAIKPYLVATIDPVSGQRAPAMAFMDQTIVASQRAQLFSAINGNDIPYGFQVLGYPTGPINEESRPAFGRVQILDEDQGVIHVSSQLDPYRFGDRVLPGLVEADTMPNYDPTQWRNSPATFDSVAGNGKVPQLKDGFKLAILLTAIPAAPNNNNQFERIIIRPNDVMDTIAGISPKASEGLLSANGPAMEIRIQPGTATALIAWDDSRSDDIEKIFGVQDGEANTDGLVVNKSDGGTVRGEASNAVSIDIVAKFVAAAKYIEMSDRMQGSAQGYIRQINPTGWLETVIHNVLADGQAITTLQMKDRLPAISPTSLMDNSTRRILLKMVGQ